LAGKDAGKKEVGCASAFADKLLKGLFLAIGKRLAISVEEIYIRA
jgi:hypothetical protein